MTRLAGSSLTLEATSSLPASTNPLCGESHVATAALNPQSWASHACGDVGLFSKQSSSLYLCAMDSLKTVNPQFSLYTHKFWSNLADQTAKLTLSPYHSTTVLLRSWGSNDMPVEHYLGVWSFTTRCTTKIFDRLLDPVKTGKILLKTVAFQLLTYTLISKLIQVYQH